MDFFGSGLRDENKSLRDENQSLMEENKRLTEENQKLTDENMMLRVGVKDAYSQYETLVADLAAVQQELRSVSQRLEATCQQVAASVAERMVLQNQVDDGIREVISLEVSLILQKGSMGSIANILERLSRS